MLSKIGGRKLAVTGAVLIIGLLVVCLQGDVPEGYLSLLQFTLASYIVGNVGADAASRFGKTSAPAGDMEKKIDVLVEGNQVLTEAVGMLLKKSS